MTNRPGEFELIARYFAPLAEANPGAFGLSDDAAEINSAPGHSLIVTADMLIAGVHFFPDDPPETIGAKLLRVNLSDLAAMGAEPLAYILGLALPPDWTEHWIAAFAEGLKRDQAEFGITLAGGDTVSANGAMALSLTAFGQVEAGTALRRAGAQAGDRAWVSGTIGDAVLGLSVLKGGLDDISGNAREELADRFRLPRPRVGLGKSLAGIATAAIDVSDGLIADLGHICETSGVGAELEIEQIPVSDAANEAIEAGAASRLDLICGGDDYEILFTAPDTAEARISEIAGELGLAVTPIGTITTGSGVRILDGNGGEIAVPSGGFRHF